jgi:hypothetical protein
MTWPSHRFAVLLLTSVLVIWAIAMVLLLRASTLPPEAAGEMLAVFEPGVSQDEAFAAITRAQGQPIKSTAFDFIWVVAGETLGLAGRLKQEGAIGTYRELPLNPTIAGCFGLAEAKAAATLGL